MAESSYNIVSRCVRIHWNQWNIYIYYIYILYIILYIYGNNLQTQASRLGKEHAEARSVASAARADRLAMPTAASPWPLGPKEGMRSIVCLPNGCYTFIMQTWQTMQSCFTSHHAIHWLAQGLNCFLAAGWFERCGSTDLKPCLSTYFGHLPFTSWSSGATMPTDQFQGWEPAMGMTLLEEDVARRRAIFILGLSFYWRNRMRSCVDVGNTPKKW